MTVAALLTPFILLAGALQALGNAMNAQLRGRMVNPWLAATVSFLPIVFVFVTLFLVMPTPLPTLDGLGRMPWYAPLGGLAGAVAVFGGLAFIDKVGAGPFNGLTLTANIVTSLAMDALGLFGLQAAGFKPLPWLGGLLMAVGVVFIARTGGKTDGGKTDEGKAGGGHSGGGVGGKLLYPFILGAGALMAVGVVWNAQLRDQLVAIYDEVSPAQVTVTGTPQFDFHFRREFHWTRAEFCRRVGADPTRPLVLYSTGMANQ